MLVVKDMFKVVDPEISAFWFPLVPSADALLFLLRFPFLFRFWLYCTLCLVLLVEEASTMQTRRFEML